MKKVFKGIWRFFVRLIKAERGLVLLVDAFVVFALANTLFKISSIYLYYKEGLTPDELFDIIIELIKVDNPDLSKKLFTKKMIKKLKRVYFWPEPI